MKKDGKMKYDEKHGKEEKKLYVNLKIVNELLKLPFNIFNQHLIIFLSFSNFSSFTFFFSFQVPRQLETWFILVSRRIE